MTNRSLSISGSRRVKGNFIQLVRASKSTRRSHSATPKRESPYRHLPEELKSSKNFLLYKLQPKSARGKRGKVPVSPTTGLPLSSWQHPESWLSFSEAHALYLKRPDLFDGLGYAMSGNRLICVDIDEARDEHGGYTPLAMELLRTIPGWVEVSTSGNLHIWTRGEWPQGKSVNPELGIEIFYGSGFVALTGNSYEEGRSIPEADIDLGMLEAYVKRTPAAEPLDAFERYSKREANLSLSDARKILMEELPLTPHREEWLRVGMALHFQFEAAYEALELWDEFSQREDCGEYLGFSHLEAQWNSFSLNHPNPITFSSLRELINKTKIQEIVLAENPYASLDLTKEKPVRYLLNGLINEGIALFIGASNAGKTTLLLDLVCVIAQLCPEDHFLRIKGRRKVIYITEDVEQIERLLIGKLKFGGLEASPAEINEWFKVIEAKKFDHHELAALLASITEKETVSAQGKRGVIQLPPLFVIDTASASLKIEDENSNSEVSDYIATLKAAISRCGSSVWVTAHSPKASSNVDAHDLSARGAGAWGANVQTVVGIKRDVVAIQTILSVSKNRIQTQFNELEFSTSFFDSIVEDDYGDMQTITYVIGELKASSTKTRLEEKDKKKAEGVAQRRTDAISECMSRIMEFVRLNPLQNQQSLREHLGGSNQVREAALSRLIKEGYLSRDKTTPEERAQSGRQAVLRLTELEYPPSDCGAQLSLF